MKHTHQRSQMSLLQSIWKPNVTKAVVCCVHEEQRVVLAQCTDRSDPTSLIATETIPRSSTNNEQARIRKTKALTKLNGRRLALTVPVNQCKVQHIRVESSNPTEIESEVHRQLADKNGWDESAFTSVFIHSRKTHPSHRVFGIGALHQDIKSRIMSPELSRLTPVSVDLEEFACIRGVFQNNLANGKQLGFMFARITGSVLLLVLVTEHCDVQMIRKIDLETNQSGATSLNDQKIAHEIEMFIISSSQSTSSPIPNPVLYVSDDSTTSETTLSCMMQQLSVPCVSINTLEIVHGYGVNLIHHNGMNPYQALVMIGLLTSNTEGYSNGNPAV